MSTPLHVRQPEAAAVITTKVMNNDKTHFGYETVAEQEKARRVADVFDSVASRYDLMNDLMSGGMHRLWKAFTIQRSGVREGSRVLDVAGGTGDLSLAFAKKVGKSGVRNAAKNGAKTIRKFLAARRSNAVTVCQ